MATAKLKLSDDEVAAIRKRLAAEYHASESDQRIEVLTTKHVRFEETKLYVADQYNLPVADMRVQQTALLVANQRSTELSIIAGKVVASTELEALSRQIHLMMGKPPTDLVIRFVEGFTCRKCKTAADEGEAAAEAEAKAKAEQEAVKTPEVMEIAGSGHRPAKWAHVRPSLVRYGPILT